MTLGNDLVNVIRFDAKTDKLEPHTTVAVNAKTRPHHFVFHPNGKLVYLLGDIGFGQNRPDAPTVHSQVVRKHPHLLAVQSPPSAAPVPV